MTRSMTSRAVRRASSVLWIGAAWLAGGCSAPEPRPVVVPAVAPRAPAVRRAPCFVVALAYGTARTIERDQTLHGNDGDVIQAGKGDVVLGGRVRLAVLEIDLATGALGWRLEIPIGDGVELSAAAIRGDEIALHVYGDGAPANARIDLAGRRYEVAEPRRVEGMIDDHVLASDGVAYYEYCKRGELCRGVDWEVRGNPIGLEDRVRFDAIAVAGGELYGIEDTSVHVIDLGSKRETRRFAIARDDHGSGVGISGDELVTADRRKVTRHDRATGAVRGSVALALPDTVMEFRLTCGR